MHTPLISVAICTYNRAELLDLLLQTLCEQNLESSFYEIIVVDNNSKDNTRAVAESFCAQNPNFYYFFEPNQGLSYARNRGWQEASGRYVAYVDDECKVPRHWLSVAKTIIDKFSPGAFGGPIIGYFNERKPRWYRYGSSKPIDKARFLHSGEYGKIYGGNSFFKKKILVKAGGFDTSFGMSGKKIGYGEETALLKKISLIYQETLYLDPNLFLYHLVLKKKMTWSYNIHAAFAAGRSLLENDPNTIDRNKIKIYLLKNFLRTSVALIIDILRGILSRNRDKYPYIQNYFYENSLKYVRQLGKIYALYFKDI
jgi:glycosyltransferase involved in cell wall biosynthesis